MAFKPIDPRRDEFRRYLERSCVIEACTKILVKLLRNRPADPKEFILRNLGDAVLHNGNANLLQSELNETKNKIKRLNQLIEKRSCRGEHFRLDCVMR